MAIEDFIKVRTRVGARWKEDEVADLKAMVKEKHECSEIAEVLCRTTGAIVDRLRICRLLYKAEYMPEVQSYFGNVLKFGKNNNNWKQGYYARKNKKNV